MLVTVTLNLTYTLMVGAEPTAIKKPAARCPECGSELESHPISNEQTQLQHSMEQAKAEVIP
jgi:uncharacterized protein with PIN domain